MYRPVILISNPDFRTVETPQRTSFCFGFPDETWWKGEEWLSDESAIESKSAAWGDALVIQVIRAQGTPVELRIWRPVLSFYEPYFAVLSDGRILLTDHLRSIIAEMPLERRTLRDDAVTDFMLFRSTPGTLTYCEGVERVGRGERVTIDLRSGDIRRAQYDKLRNIAEKAPCQTYLEGIDRALEEVTAPLRNAGNMVSLFSGGVDSTLLQSYIGEHVPVMMGHLWSMLDFERSYCERAAKLLNVDLHTFSVEEHEYLPLLEEATEAAGVPFRFDQFPMIYKAFLQPWDVFAGGAAADCIFGLDHVKGGVMHAARLLARAPGGSVIAGALGRARPRQLARLGALTKDFLAPPVSGAGFAASDCLVTDMDLAGRIFGTRRILERLQERVNCALPAMEFSTRPGDRVGRHLELSHLTTQIVEDHMELVRHLAHGAGKRYVGPYLTRPVVDSSLRIPVSERYVRGGRSKYLLKDLLKRRLPDYPVDQQKGMGLIEAESFYTDGPMQDIWERYALPDVLTGADRAKFLERPTTMTFSAAALAIWRDRVLRNEKLTPAPGARRFDAGLACEP